MCSVPFSVREGAAPPRLSDHCFESLHMGGVCTSTRATSPGTGDFDAPQNGRPVQDPVSGREMFR